MRLKLHNILKIENADIEIGGLTVLTGENDSGKSTVGKILFSLIKAVNNVREVDKMKTASMVRYELVHLKRMFKNLENISFLDDPQSLSLNLIDGAITIDELHQRLVCEVDNRNFTSRQVAVMQHHLGRIHKFISKLENPETAFREEFEMISKSEFMEPLTSFGCEKSSILFYDDTTDADGSSVEINISNGKVDSARQWGNPSLDDITYIESPLYLHIINTLRLSNPSPSASSFRMPTSLRRENLPYHLGDMAEKILTGSEELPSLFNSDFYKEDYSNQLNEISSIIGGEFILNSRTKQLTFKQKGHAIPPISVASGIKSFGVLQRLLQTDNVSTFKMLIWDEPEIHLHPQWQIVFCKLIIELVAKGFPVVISSHSPYFVQALRYFAAAKGIEKDVKYYMAEEDNGTMLSSFKEVTDDLNSVFTLLASPLHEIMNVDAVRNSMR